jgi:hypothetical protein
VRDLTREERALIKATLHGALDGRNGTVCSPARPERYEMLCTLLRDGFMEGGERCVMTGHGLRYFYVSAAGVEAVTE